jgi:RHS repeat-associated protein
MSLRSTIVACVLLVTGSPALAADPAEGKAPVIQALGEFRSVSVGPSNGAVVESLPILATRGRHGMQPNLALQYSSSGGHGDLGLGWSVESGRIERSRREGTPSVGPERFAFSMPGAGSELVPAGGDLWRARFESAWRLFRRVGQAWEMVDGQGMVFRFGTSIDARIDSELWLLESVTDTSGNTITYEYERDGGTPWLTRVRYTGHAPSGEPGTDAIVVEWEQRADGRVRWTHGVREVLARRLAAVSVRAGGELARRYELHYQPSPVNGEALLSRVELVGADGRSRIVARSYGYSERSRMWAGASRAIALPDFNAADGRDLGVRQLDVDGDGRLDLVKNGDEVLLGDGAGGFALDARFTQSLRALQTVFVGADGRDAGVRLVDVDGDLRPDVVIATLQRREVWLNTGREWIFDPVLSTSLQTISENAYVNRSYVDPGCTQAHCDPAQPVAGCSPPHCTGTNDPDPCSPAHCAADTAPPACQPAHCDEPTLISEGIAFVDSVGDSRGVELADVNGDGRLDILWSLTRTEFLWQYQDLGRVPVSFRAVYLNVGDGWVRSDVLSAGLAAFEFTLDSEIMGWSVIDLNGDGLADLVQGLASLPRAAYLGTGSGWVRDEEYSASMADPALSAYDASRSSLGLMPIDVNDDGLSDYVRADDAVVRVWRNDGRRLVEDPALTAEFAARGIRFAVGSGLPSGTVLGDVNGDGLLDVLQSVEGGSHAVRFEGGPRSGLLVRASGGYGEVTELSYVPSSLFDNRRADGIQGLPMVQWLATSLARSPSPGERHETTYNWGAGLFEGGEMRAYGWSSAVEPNGLRTVRWLRQDEGLAGQLMREESYDRSNRLRRRKSFSQATVAAAPGVTQTQLVQTDTEDFDYPGTRHQRTRMGYDEFLNLTYIAKDGEVAVSGDEWRTELAWARGDVTGVRSLPSRVRILDAAGALLSESISLYDGQPFGAATRGLLTSTRDLVNVGGRYTRKDFEYDAYGNLVRGTDRTGHAATFEYDETHTYRVSSTDASGAVTRTQHDPRFSVATRDENGSGGVTVRSYDAFGRITRVREPGDECSPNGTRSYEYSAVGNPLEQRVLVRATETQGRADTLDTVIRYDGFGQVHRVEAEAAGGRWAVSATEFDDVGSPRRIARPSFAGEAQAWTVLERDELRRPTRVVAPDGVEQVTRYAGYETEVTDRRGNKTVFVRDASETLVEIRQTVDRVVQTTRFGHDALGRRTTVVDPIGQVTRFGYDALGRRTRLEDPVAGTFTYEHDDDGRPLAQTAPDGRRATFEYDSAGRLRTKLLPDGQVQRFTLGAAGTGNGAGKVVAIDDAAGRLELRYDERGNVAERRRTVLGRTYLTAYAYDTLGRIRRLFYPDGFMAQYEYDPGGRLASISDGSGKAILSGATYSASGQLTGWTMGNGVASTFGYDDVLRMASIRTSGPAGVLQDLGYGYDPGGNVVSISDRRWGADQAFTYDEINRLTGAVGRYGEETYEYDAVGNLVRKGSLLFAFDPTSPSRATCAIDLALAGAVANGIVNNPHLDSCTDRLAGPSGRVAPAHRAALGVIRARGTPGSAEIARSFAVRYDALGNVVEKNGRRFDYDSESRLVRVTDPNGQVVEENVYDAAGSRVVHRTQARTTVFIDGVYEENGSTASRHVRAGPVMVATLVRPLAGVRLAQSAPARSDGCSIAERSGGCGTAGGGGGAQVLIGLLLLAAAWIGSRSAWRRGAGAALRETTERVGGRPWRCAIALLLIPAYLLASAPNAQAAAPQGEPERRLFYHSDHLGGVGVVSDERGSVVSRREYTPWGETVLETGPQGGPSEVAYAFDGQRLDEATGLYYMGSRHYDPVMGRFLSPDSQVPDPENPKALNRYAFALDNPVRYVDPSGHGFWDIVLGVVVAVVVIVVIIAVAVLAPAVAFAVILGAVIGAAIGVGVMAYVAIKKFGLGVGDADFWKLVLAGFSGGALIGAGAGWLIAVVLLGAGVGAGAATIMSMALIGGASGAVVSGYEAYKAISAGDVDGAFAAMMLGIAIGLATGALTGGATELIPAHIMGSIAKQAAIDIVTAAAATLTGIRDRENRQPTTTPKKGTSQPPDVSQPGPQYLTAAGIPAWAVGETLAYAGMPEDLKQKRDPFTTFVLAP